MQFVKYWLGLRNNMVRKFKSRIKRTVEFQGVWHRADANVPDDHRDVMSYIWKAAWHDEKKKMIPMKTMQVIHYQKKAWWLDGRAMEPTHVLKWCEIPDGWQK